MHHVIIWHMANDHMIIRSYVSYFPQNSIDSLISSHEFRPPGLAERCRILLIPPLKEELFCMLLYV